MFAGQINGDGDEPDVVELAKLGEKMISDLKALKASGRMTPEQKTLYDTMLEIYNKA